MMASRSLAMAALATALIAASPVHHGVRVVPVPQADYPSIGGVSGAASFSAPDGDRFVIPFSALREAGRRLSLSRFDETALARHRPSAPTTLIQPGSPLHTLRLIFTDMAGKPANNVSACSLQNTDDLHRAWMLIRPVHGVAQVSVPVGHYSVFCAFGDSDAHNNLTALRAVEIVDFTVPATAGVTRLPVDERTAVSRVSVATPRPATADLMSLDMYRASLTGGAVTSGASWAGAPEPRLFVNAQPAAKIGRFRDVFHWGGAQPATDSTKPAASGSYRYDVVFGANDIAKEQRFTVRPSQLATVRENFFADPASAYPSGNLGNTDIDPVMGTDTGMAAVNGDTAPGTITQYLGTADGGRWQQWWGDEFDWSADPRTFAAGHTYTVDWAHGPLATGLGQHNGPWTCQACTAGFEVTSLIFSPLIDSEPDHVYVPELSVPQARSHLVVYRDGTRIFDAAGTDGVVVYGAPAASATYRAILDESFAGTSGVSQSTSTHTDLTVRVAPVNREPFLPAEDTCDGKSDQTECIVLPALTLSYQLATNGHNVSSAGVQKLSLRVAHVSYDGVSASIPVKSASVFVSFDSGRTWQRATMTGSGGTYSASWSNPASARGTSPELKVTAADTGGDSITQVTTNAYTIAGARPGPGPQRD